VNCISFSLLVLIALLDGTRTTQEKQLDYGLAAVTYTGMNGNGRRMHKCSDTAMGLGSGIKIKRGIV
jgi:hypothetical protein